MGVIDDIEEIIDAFDAVGDQVAAERGWRLTNEDRLLMALGQSPKYLRPRPGQHPPIDRGWRVGEAWAFIEPLLDEIHRMPGVLWDIHPLEFMWRSWMLSSALSWTVKLQAEDERRHPEAAVGAWDGFAHQLRWLERFYATHPRNRRLDIEIGFAKRQGRPRLLH